MNDFLLFIDDLRRRFPIHVEIYYSKIMDWNIKVYRKGMAGDYPQSTRDGNDAVICNVQDNDMKLCFAKAHAGVKAWLCLFEGGY